MSEVEWSASSSQESRNQEYSQARATKATTERKFIVDLSMSEGMDIKLSSGL